MYIGGNDFEPLVGFASFQDLRFNRDGWLNQSFAGSLRARRMALS
jgi:hypothetical protein